MDAVVAVELGLKAKGNDGYTEVSEMRFVVALLDSLDRADDRGAVANPR